MIEPRSCGVLDTRVRGYDDFYRGCLKMNRLSGCCFLLDRLHASDYALGRSTRRIDCHFLKAS